MSPPNADPYKRRTSKACEHCRTKRTRCTGSSPCDACIALGLGDACYVREKARPRRAPAASKRRKKTDTPSPAFGHAHAHFVRDVELAIDSWLESAGHTARTALPGPSRIMSTISGTPLPSDPHALAALEDRLLLAYRHMQFFEFLPPGRVEDLYVRHRNMPDSLAADQRALIASALCLGRLSELMFDFNAPPNGQMIHSPRRGESREDVTYFRLALSHLEQWGAASCTALCALHCLHLVVQLIGGPDDMRELLGAMCWHVRELGLHRHETAAAYSAMDRPQQLFFSTFYKDTWFSTLIDAPPITRWGEFEYDPSISTEVPPAGPLSRHQGTLSRIAVLESELMTTIHSGKVDTQTPEFILSTESKWLPLMRECVDGPPEAGLLSLLHPYAEIRFNWIRLLLRAPVLSHPTLGASSMPIIARSVARILNAYASIVTTKHFHPCYAQLRRITTCGQLLVLCHTARELNRGESEELFAVLLQLLNAHMDSFDFIPGLIASFESIGMFLGLTITPETARAPVHAEVPIMFDYSLPSWFDAVYEPDHMPPQDV